MPFDLDGVEKRLAVWREPTRPGESVSKAINRTKAAREEIEVHAPADLAAACIEIRALREALERAVSHLDDKDSYCGIYGDDGCGAIEDGRRALYALDHGCDVEDVTVCGYCGQPYLMPDLAQVLYHEQRPHRPMAAPEWSGESQRVALADADASAPSEGGS